MNTSPDIPLNIDPARFVRDLTQEIKKGKGRSVIGRHREMESLVRCLSRTSKNNVILLGEAGVGKTAFMEAFATELFCCRVPEALRGRPVLEVSTAALFSGCAYVGMIEQRITDLVKMAKESKAILFIDEIHLLNDKDEPALAIFGELLKPELARGELTVIGATTKDEYTQSIARDPALDRRFSVVSLEEPDFETTMEILRYNSEFFSKRHHVEISDEAMVAAIELSRRYLPERFLPDKALDLLDDAAVLVRSLEVSLESPIHSLRFTIKGYEAKRLRQPLTVRDQRIFDSLCLSLDELEKKQAFRVEQMPNLQALERLLSDKLQKINECARTQDYALRDRIRFGEIPGIEAALNALRLKMDIHEKPIVLRETIAQVISTRKLIPIASLNQNERDQLLMLEQSLKDEIFGQDHAVVSITNSIIQARVGLHESHRPWGSFLFTGPSGVGKTAIAKALAACLMSDERNLLQFDMGAFHDSTSIAQLIGAPPGYKDSDQEGQLTGKIRKNPFQVILFDEMEKADHSIQNLLLQVLDEGRLVDAMGRTANFGNTIVLVTTNLAQGTYTEGERDTELRKYFRPEILNRFDGIISFLPLSDESLVKIALSDLTDLTQLALAQKVIITFSPELPLWIVLKSKNLDYGARPIRHFIKENIRGPLAKILLSQSSTSVNFKVVNDKITHE